MRAQLNCLPSPAGCVCTSRVSSREGAEEGVGVLGPAEAAEAGAGGASVITGGGGAAAAAALSFAGAWACTVHWWRRGQVAHGEVCMRRDDRGERTCTACPERLDSTGLVPGGALRLQTLKAGILKVLTTACARRKGRQVDTVSRLIEEEPVGSLETSPDKRGTLRSVISRRWQHPTPCNPATHMPGAPAVGRSLLAAELCPLTGSADQ